MFWLILVLGNTKLLNINEMTPILEIHDGLILTNDHFFNNPFDVLVLDSKIFIIGGFPHVYIFEKNALVSTFGEIGEGPHEFRHWPTTIESYNDQIIVTEMYGWSRSFFNNKGAFIKKEQLSKNFIYSRSRKYSRLNRLKDEGIPYRLKKNTDCYLAQITSSNDLDFHLSEFILLEDNSDRNIIVKLSGIVEYYNENCRMLKKFQLPVGDITRKPIKDPILTKLENKLHHAQRTYYQYGHPIFDAALDTGNEGTHVWMLASNELKITKRLKPGEVWLLHLELETGEVRRVKLNHIADKIRVFDDKLVLISTDEAMVRIYSKNDVLALH